MVLVPRHGTSPLGCCALWHGMTLSEGFSAMPGPESRHGGTTRHGTTVTPCLIVPCRVVLVPCSASAARLENYSSDQLANAGELLAPGKNFLMLLGANRLQNAFSFLRINIHMLWCA